MNAYLWFYVLLFLIDNFKGAGINRNPRKLDNFRGVTIYKRNARVWLIARCLKVNNNEDVKGAVWTSLL